MKSNYSLFTHLTFFVLLALAAIVCRDRFALCATADNVIIPGMTLPKEFSVCLHTKHSGTTTHETIMIASEEEFILPTHIPGRHFKPKADVEFANVLRGANLYLPSKSDAITGAHIGVYTIDNINVHYYYITGNPHNYLTAMILSPWESTVVPTRSPDMDSEEDWDDIRIKNHSDYAMPFIMIPNTSSNLTNAHNNKKEPRPNRHGS